MSLKEQFKKLQIDSKDIKAGDIWKIKDVKVVFPGRDGGEEGKTRYVLIFQNDDFNSAALIETVSAIPITTRFGRSATSLTLEVGEGGLYERSQLKAAFIQPLRKIDLETKLGTLSPERFEEVQGLVAHNLGLLGDEEE